MLSEKAVECIDDFCKNRINLNNFSQKVDFCIKSLYSKWIDEGGRRIWYETKIKDLMQKIGNLEYELKEVKKK